MKPALFSTLSYGLLRAARNLLAAAILAAGPALADPPQVVMLGDSLTQGYGLPPEQGLVPQLQTWLDAHGTQAVLVNAGVSGDTTAGGLARLDWSLTPETRALVVILGGNDMLRGLDPALAHDNLAGILKGAGARGLPVLLVAMRAPGNYGPDYKARFDAIYPALAAEYGALLADHFFAPLTGDGSDPAAARPWMQADGIHPNAEGVAKVVDWLGPQVQKLLQQAR
ncbi:MAG: arylesterase [Paracoccaceae bacterium]